MVKKIKKIWIIITKLEDIKKTHEWESRDAKYYIWNKNKLVWLIADYTLQKAGGKNNEIEDIVIETIQNETKRGKRLKNK